MFFFGKINLEMMVKQLEDPSLLDFLRYKESLVQFLKIDNLKFF